MKSILHLLFVLSLLFATGAMAEQTPYSQPIFDKLIKDGKPVLVEVSAGWCSTLHAQARITDALLREPSYRGIRVLKIDYDRQEAALRTLRVARQSTLIVFKNDKEVGHSLGDTSHDGIESLLKRAI